MNTEYQEIQAEQGAVDNRKPYETPAFERIELALEETLSSGCKLAGDAGCVGPIVQAFLAGS